MIKNIIFDIGGVLIFHDKKLMSKILLRLFPNNFEEIMEIWNENRSLLNTGKLSSLELIKKMNVEIKSNFSDEYLYEKFIDLYKQESVNINTELLQWIKKNKNTYNMFALSDTIDVHLEHNFNRKIFDDFKQIFNSNIEGVAKIEGEKAFLNLVNKTKINPDESIFIDDSPTNILIAQNLGFETIPYIGFEDFLTKIHNYSN